MSKSAKIAGLDLDTTRTVRPPSVAVSGTADKLVPRNPTQPEKAQIRIHLPDTRYRDLRIDNAFTNEHGDDVKLKKGTNVQVIVTAKE